MTSKLVLFTILTTLVCGGSAIWCYHCVNTQPGCGDDFNWLYHWTKICPEDDDVCVKIIEKKGAQELVTRDCLSSLTFRSDIPADKYEGCRKAAVDVKLGNYVNHSIKEHDIHRRHFDDTTWCFCFLDHRCNMASLSMPSIFIPLLSVLIVVQRFL